MAETFPELDELDFAIIRFLETDGRMPYTTIASELNVAESTVRKRITRLIDSKVLEIVAIPDPVKVGLGTVALIGVKIEGDDLQTAVEILQEKEMVRFIGVTTGTFDLMIGVTMDSNERLFDFVTHTLRKIPGVVGSQTSLILKVFKQRV
ncbi:MAG: Lrp/AsnC family transcriptional regulator [Firmicutes bacterium]|nr:Lrp/AsnC family transcriptional regulator [Bacillota bacterium]